MEETITTLIEKVNELYNKYGIKSVTMDDVAHELGISKKTLYQLVSDKDELVKKVVEYENAKKRKELTNIFENNKNAIEELLDINKFVIIILSEYSPTVDYDLKKYYPKLFEDIMRKKGEHMFNSLLENIKKGKKEGLYRKSINEVLIARSYIMRMESCTRSNYFDQEEFSTSDFINETFEYHIRGIVNESGLKMFKKLKKQERSQDED